MSNNSLEDSLNGEGCIDSQNSVIDTVELWSVFWHGRFLIFVVTTLLTLGSIAYSFMQPEIYRSEVLLAPSESRQSSSPLTSQLGGAAALVGINLGQAGGDKINSTLAVLQSRDFLLGFINENELQVPLFAGFWDADAGLSKIDGGIFNEIDGSWQQGTNPPTDWQSYRKFRSILSLNRDSESGLIRLSIDWTDPVLATTWANLLVVAINNHEKNRDLEEATGAIEYLEEQLAGTQLVEMQRVFYQLIESQTRIIMLADARIEYVFQVIDPAVIPDQRISPQRRVIAIVGFLLGVLFSLIWVVGYHLVVDRKIFTMRELESAK